MKNLKWLAIVALTAMVLTTAAGEALAQRRGGAIVPPAGFIPHAELSATYGSMWGGNIDLTYNTFNNVKLRTGTGPSYGLALDYYMSPAQAIEISYTRQDGSLDLDYQGITTLTDMSVNYWQIGSIRTLAPGRVQPFVLGSLGATYYSPSQDYVQIDENDSDTTYNVTSTTKFSMTLGLGFKSYFGEAQKVGLRGTFKVCPTFYNTSGGLWFGTGGGGISVGGNAIWQWEAAIGLTVKLGG